MFILNFDYILDDGSSDSLERLNQTSPSKADQCEYKEQFMSAVSIITHTAVLMDALMHVHSRNT